MLAHNLLKPVRKLGGEGPLDATTEDGLGACPSNTVYEVLGV